MLVLMKILFLKLFSAIRHKKNFCSYKWLISLAGFIFLPTMIIFQTKDLFRLWIDIPQFGLEFLLGFMSTALLGLFIMLFFTSLPSVLTHFYLSPDLSLFAPLPLKKEVIYRFKFLEASLGNFGLFFIFGFPVLVSFCLAIKGHVIFLFIILIVSLLFSAIPTGLAILASVLFTRFFAIKSLRRFTALTVGILLFAAWGGFQLLHLSRLDPVSIDFDPSMYNLFLMSGEKIQSFLFPSDWMLNTIYSAMTGNWSNFFFYFVLLTLTASALYFICAKIRHLFDNNMPLQTFLPVTKKPSKSVKGYSKIVQLITAHTLKDFHLIIRDVRLLQGNLLFVFMIIIWPLIGISGLSQSVETLRMYEPYIPLTILVVISAVGVSRQNIPIERMSFQYLKISPQKLYQILIIKSVRSALIIICAVTISLLLFLFIRNADPRIVLLVLVANWLIALGGSSIGQCAGALGVKFDWINPRYMVDTGMTYLSMAVAIIFSLISIGIVILGMMTSQLIIAFIFYFVYVCVVFWSGILLASRRLDKGDWIY